MHLCWDDRLRRRRAQQPFEYSDPGTQVVVVSGNPSHHIHNVNSNQQHPINPPPSSHPIPRVRVSSLNASLNPHFPPSLKRPFSLLNPTHHQQQVYDDHGENDGFDVEISQHHPQQVDVHDDDDDDDNDDGYHVQIEQRQQQRQQQEEIEEELEENDKEETSCSAFLSPLMDRKGDNSHIRRGKKFSGIDMDSVKYLLEAVVAHQNRCFKDLLESLERNERERERIRAEKEEKWRAEERAHRKIIDNAMIVLTETLLCQCDHDGRIGGDVLGFDGENGENKGKKKRGKNWKRGEVLQLIELREDMKDRFSNCNHKGAVWNELAEVLASCGVNRDGKQCREKWDKLVASYKDIVDGKRDAADFPYFANLCNVVGFGNGGVEF